MVNFNPAEFRAWHGRWGPGGPHHAHIRHSILGAAIHAGETAVKDTERDVKKTARDAERERRAADEDIRRTGERMARASGVSRSELTRAERAAGIGTGRGAEKDTEKEADRAKSDEKKATREARRRYHPLLRHALMGRRRSPLSSVLRAASLARLLKKSTTTKKAAAKKKAAVKAPKKKAAAKKPAAKKAAAAKRPVTIKPPKAPTGKRATGKGKGAGQKVTPSAQVMANLNRYLLAPGGARAGVGTAGRSSMSSTGTTAGSRVGGAGRSLAVGRRG